jgi:iron complex transport system substrate-binding protein
MQAGKGGATARSQETTLVRATSYRPSGEGLVALYVVGFRFRTYVAGVLRERMPVLHFESQLRDGADVIPAFGGMTMTRRTRMMQIHRSPITWRVLASPLLTVLLCACNNDKHNAAPAVQPVVATTLSRSMLRDDFGRAISYAASPQRVVSLNPTTTETIFAIGAGSRLIGRSLWDEWPAAAKAVPDMGNGIGVNVEQIVAAHPDLVLLYASEDNRPAADRLESSGIHTLSLRIDRVADFNRAIAILGRVLGDSARASLVADTVNASLRRVQQATNNLPHPTVVWPLIDTSPMVVGGGSFMNELLQFAGARNVYADLQKPSPMVSLEDVAARNPDFVIRGGEGGSTAELGGAWRAVPAVALGHVIRIPLTLILRPSVQMGAAATILARALHPGIALP